MTQPVREAEALAKKHLSGESLFDGLRRIFIQVRAITKNTEEKLRIKIHNNLITELKQWINYAECYQELRKFATKLKNGLDYWCTRVLNPKIEPTNNLAEQKLREPIVQRKIFGTLRNEKGTKIMEILLSLITTWKNNQLNSHLEIAAAL